MNRINKLGRWFCCIANSKLNKHGMGRNLQNELGRYSTCIKETRVVRVELKCLFLNELQNIFRLNISSSKYGRGDIQYFYDTCSVTILRDNMYCNVLYDVCSLCHIWSLKCSKKKSSRILQLILTKWTLWWLWTIFQQS